MHRIIPGKMRGKSRRSFKMASNRGNTPKRKKNSMAEELMALVSDEEYVERVVCLTEDEYLTKTEVASLRKMISGKLWIDGRKFMNRKNQCVPTGMYEVFGSYVSKSAITVHTELVTYFLEPDQKPIRDVLRQSAKINQFSYSTWITDMNNLNKPCDEYVLYLLCRCYNRHACVITSKRILCTFKTGTMSMFEKLCKCDLVLIWLGESTYAELKPLQTPKGLGPLQEWNLAAECILHLHEKNLAAKRPRKQISTKSSNLATTQSTSSKPDKDSVHDNKRRRKDIDYKQYHNEGTVIPRSPVSANKPLPRASGPSAERIAAQSYIVNEKRVKLEPVATNRLTRVSRKLVKEEPDVHIIHRKEKLIGPERVTHPSGRLCKTHNKGGYWDDELPDLVPERTTTKETRELKSPPKASRCSGRISTQLVETPVTCVASLLSGFFPEVTSTVKARTETTDTLNTVPLSTAKTQEQPVKSSVSEVLSGYLLAMPTRNVTTTRAETTPNDAPKTPITVDIISPAHSPRKEEGGNRMPTKIGDTPAVTTHGTERDVENEIPDVITPGKNSNQTRTVITKKTNQIEPPTEIDALLSDDVDELDLIELQEAAEKKAALRDLFEVTDCDAVNSRAVTTCTTPPPNNQASHDSQPDNTPSRDELTTQTTKNREPANLEVTETRDEITTQTTRNRELADLEVAETLLQLHASSPEPLSENEQILPVDAPKQYDIVKEMEAENEKNSETLPEQSHAHSNATSDDDDADTIIYEHSVTPTREHPSVTRPRRGTVTFKHYGIPRWSPKQTITRKHRCLVCGKSKNSKKELNDHHRKEHSGVICPTCGKEFATADSYQRHRYIHRNPAQHKCTICDKILPFDSDLQRHMSSHTEGTRWYCSHPPANETLKERLTWIYMRLSTLVCHKNVLGRDASIATWTPET